MPPTFGVVERVLHGRIRTSEQAMCLPVLVTGDQFEQLPVEILVVCDKPLHGFSAPASRGHRPAADRPLAATSISFFGRWERRQLTATYWSIPGGKYRSWARRMRRAVRSMQ